MTKPRPFGHYFILEKIAQGGMAEIFKGLTYDFSGIKKFIVIKRILPHIAANKEFIDMLISEAKIAVNLSHGNIAQIFDLGKVGTDYFIVMEYVDGKSLSQIQRKCLEKSILLPVEYGAYFVSELCNGLDYIHRRKDEAGNELKIVHRDISPQNVIVSYSGNVKIVDFGVAKAAFKLGEAEKGILKGKFAYMSPEQADGLEIDNRSDLFSAGIVLWELLTSQRLFKKKSNSETVEAVKKMAVVPPSQFRPDVPPELDQIALRALSKDPDLRYSSAHDMSLDLTKYLLKFHSDFKPSSIDRFLPELFGHDEEVTGDIHFEKTTKGEPTLVEYTRSYAEHTGGLSVPSVPQKPEITAVVNPDEIDFRSIFDEISWEEEESDEDSPAIELIEPKDLNPASLSNYDDLSVTGMMPLPPPKSPAVKGPQRPSWLGPAVFLLIFAALLVLMVFSLK